MASISLVCRLKVEQAQISRPSAITPLLGLSPLELEVLVDDTLNQSKLEREGSSTSGSSYGSRYPIFANVKRTEISTEELLQYPQIFIDKTESGFSVTYNPELRERVNQKILELKRGNEYDKNLDNLVSQLSKDRKWIEETQIVIVQYVCQLEADYINSGNPFDSKPLMLKDVGSEFGYNPSTISRLMKNLTIRMPDGNVIFATELIPSKSQNSLRVKYAIEQLSTNPEYFRESAWQITDNQTAKILQQEYGLPLLKRRTVNKYTTEFEKKHRTA